MWKCVDVQITPLPPFHCIPDSLQFKIHTFLGVLTERGNATGDSHYWTLFWETEHNSFSNFQSPIIGNSIEIALLMHLWVTTKKGFQRTETEKNVFFVQERGGGGCVSPIYWINVISDYLFSLERLVVAWQQVHKQLGWEMKVWKCEKSKHLWKRVSVKEWKCEIVTRRATTYRWKCDNH